MSTPERLPFPFQVSHEELLKRIDEFVVSTVQSLSSFYLELPRGENFLEYEPFKMGFDDLFRVTKGFTILDRHAIHEAVKKNGMILVILRCIVGLSPPELADLANDKMGVKIEQGFARNQDAEAKRGKNPLARTKPGSDTEKRLHALIDATLEAIEKGPETAASLIVHRLDKIDTALGLKSVQKVAKEGVEYPILLYERMLGRPFASHRDSVSSQVGDIVEAAVIQILENSKVPFHKTGRAEAVPGFDQAPDFLIPDIENPKVVIEAKLTQDDGTARDKDLFGMPIRFGFRGLA